MSETGDAWDAQIAADVKAGRLDWLADEARKEHASGKTVECDMSETPSGLYDVFETSSGKFRRWHSTGTIECMINGTWRSIPSVAQAEITRLRSALAARTEECARVAETGFDFDNAPKDMPREVVILVQAATSVACKDIASAIRALPTEGHSQ